VRYSGLGTEEDNNLYFAMFVFDVNLLQIYIYFCRANKQCDHKEIYFVWIYVLIKSVEHILRNIFFMTGHF
jgi:hypothetical protein